MLREKMDCAAKKVAEVVGIKCRADCSILRDVVCTKISKINTKKASEIESLKSQLKKLHVNPLQELQENKQYF